MRAYLPDFRVITTEDLGEALGVLDEGVVPLAGGTDLMVYLESGQLKPCCFLDLQAIPELRRGPRLDGVLILSPLCTFRDARVLPEIRGSFPLLAAAAREVGVIAVQSRGTWAGNIANASPAADGVPALMAYDAEIELSSRNGSRRVQLARFYRGYKLTDRRTDELITAIRLPLPAPGWRGYFRKVGTRRFQAISKTLLAGRVLMGTGGEVSDIRLIFGSVAPHTLRALRTEEVIRGRVLTLEVIEEAAQILQDEISPIDDMRSSAAYRRRVSANLLRDFLSGSGLHPDANRIDRA
ncbi:MAG TPA: FAD binding domain-containing protein [Acidobacteriota bacterium]|nr:FAD binding domain-containing protein [Acidobacteriota bacterium]